MDSKQSYPMEIPHTYMKNLIANTGKREKRNGPGRAAQFFLMFRMDYTNIITYIFWSIIDNVIFTIVVLLGPFCGSQRAPKLLQS